MRSRLLFALTVVSLVSGLTFAQGARRFNPMVELLSQKKPVFGLYAPSNRRFPGGGGPSGGAATRPGGQGSGATSTATPAEPPKTPAQLAKEAVDYRTSDFIFDGSMEGDFDRALPAFSELMNGMSTAGILLKAPYPHLNHSIVVKTHEIAPDPVKAAANIGKQLNLGVTGIMFVGVESAEEVKAGIAAMRFTSKGGTRPDDVGGAPAFWGMSEKEYKEKADLWPLNPNGELVNWTIVESKAGLAKVREIAAVKGIGVLWPGAGTLRGVFSTTDASGQRKLDEAAWEAAIQKVLSACKEFNLACGYPATPNDIEMRMKQGFSVFVMNWGDAGFKAVEIGRKTAGR
ncbi:MAG: aldolase/citrate lyase family protein [Vicinamibacterales bacterium]